MEIQEINRFVGFLKSDSILQNLDWKGIDDFDLQTRVSSELLTALLNLDDSQKNRLGKRVEKYLNLYFKFHPDYDLIAKHLQIEGSSQTIGEIDYIVKSLAENQLIHVELAYKFYLFDKKHGDHELEHWIGPNRNDNLKLKYDKLLHKQFPILYREETFRKLDELSVNQEQTKQSLCLKGQLFLPYHFEEYSTISQLINQDCIVGSWVNFNDFKSMDLSEFSIQLIEKKDWLISSGFFSSWDTVQNVLPSIQESIESKKSVMIVLNKNNSEFQKMFVVWW